MSKQNKNNFTTQHFVNLYFSGNSMNNLQSYCGLSDAKTRASEKDLPVNNTNTSKKSSVLPDLQEACMWALDS